ncbi:MAG: hypothetical protein MJB14_06970 [Spirochaetes bacterium]|nr:hypothetical protein [Spirochaetota bacterium]
MNISKNPNNIPKKIDIKNFVLNNEKKIPFIIGENEKVLLLYNEDIMIAYSNRSIVPFIVGINKDKYKNEGLGYPDKATSTTFLTEGNINYPASNIGNLKLKHSWVEGKKDSGIGAKIFIPKGYYSGLYFLNGFVSFKNPSLYLDNNRVKKVKVSDTNQKYNEVFELEDTPNPQLIDLKSNKNWEITIEILEIYKGNKYNDTCINSILYKGF